jgi:glycosyltransferase involved in cell wall biosynthesis
MAIIFSVVTTVLNEADTIVPLLDSLAEQTVKPGEIVIVDAGSSDGTVELVKSWQKVHPQIPIQLLIESGLNRSEGRNFGINNAFNDHIALTDAGCLAGKDWLGQFETTLAKDKDIVAVAGYYQSTGESDWQQVFGWYTGVMPDDFRADTFLPSARSLAITREGWRLAGRFPEDLTTCEDLVFAEALKKTGKMKVNPQAIVYWEQEKNLITFGESISGYAQGSVEAGYTRHMVKIGSIFARYFLFILVPPLFFLYLAFPVLKMRNKITKPIQMVYLPMVQIVSDAANIIGAIKGLPKFIGR